MFLKTSILILPYLKYLFPAYPGELFMRLLKLMILPLIIARFANIRVAELGSLSSGARMAMKIFVKRVFTIFASNASLLRVIANLQN